MSAEEECNCPPCKPGLPAWLATFGDLMSLLMCFFVLLLSFSEMDVLRFKQLAGSMREAFGVQAQIKVEDIPKGTSIIAREFSPGRPEPTPLNEVRQMTTNVELHTLDVRSQVGESVLEERQAEAEEEKRQQQEEQAQEDAMKFAMALSAEIGEGSIEVETDGTRIIIRVRERGSFFQGSARIQDDYIPVLEKIRDVLITVPGRVSVQGHTDSTPYVGRQFESNWDLSAARALAVAHELFSDPRTNESRFTVSGYAFSRPLVPNDTEANRARNRRVEIIIEKSELLEQMPIRTSPPSISEPERLMPNEIF
ncbi:type VI secretion system protein TssL [Nitrincola tibetensis]|uniref:Type VI secretion system protein TssL n=1 Tax=Nitrincola tibetensis TaxID=2219697 RepID=A0A364NJU3_9GAMM|nr:flagellar motor protein MotB [Nitrincola tibetensis]RAU17388.1 type VI secretion system protein TssL [Nitrincola tibetensis]